MTYGLGGEPLERRVVRDAVAVEDPAVAVIRVFAQADIRDQDQVGERAAKRPQGARDHAVRLVRARTPRILACGQAEQEHGAYSLVERRAGFFDGRLYAQAVDSGHRRDRLPGRTAVIDEHGVDEIGSREPSLPHQFAQGGRATQAAGSGGGE